MIVTHCWDLNPEESRQFAAKYGAVTVKNHTDLIGRWTRSSRAIIGRSMSTTRWWNPSLRRRCPSSSTARFRPRSRRTQNGGDRPEVQYTHHVRVIVRIHPDTEIAREEAQKIGKSIQGYSATNSMSDYSTHGIHGLYMIHRVIGGPLKAVSYRTPD